jgi:Ni/Fe-hydrogenase subunit HybB-like protein/Fe-S-cluster-containing dehydrogenase component
VLYDATRCIGCRQCVRACAEANSCDADVATLDDARLTPLSLTVLRRYEVGEVEAFRKMQCMHCVDPACVSGCMLGAMNKGEDGAVTWNGDLCVGCRYCEIACPFSVPRFEWDSPVPEMKKCQLCPARRAAGLEPACVASCRRGALTYGLRTDMLAEAHRRIAENPRAYNPRVYGEHDGGGTSFLYLTKAGISFADMGLPELGTTSVPTLPETVQHTIYKGFALPLALFGVLAGVVRRNTRGQRAVADPQEHAKSEAVGGRLLTWPFLILVTLALIGGAVIVWRFVAGLGATTNLNDGYPFGLWIAFDVVTGTALACGGYAVALLVYVANRGRYHPLVRAAIVTSALGYTLGGLSVLIDIGRAWNFYKIPLFMWQWNVNSILLEVALCITLYTCVLWIELSPAFLEKWQESRLPALRRFAVKTLPKLERIMPYMIALGLLLPTMHQSSLGSLMLLSGQKLHPLWQTPLLPLLFLVSCVALGYAAVTLECTISSHVFKRPRETRMLRALAGPISAVLLLYIALRLIDVHSRGAFEYVTRLDGYSVLFLVELALFALPMVALFLGRRVATDGMLAAIAVGVIVAGALYRFSTYLIAYNPGDEWSYFPALPEFAVTIGLVAAELAGYLVLVKRFPILRGAAPHGPRSALAPERPEAVMPTGRATPALQTGVLAGVLLLLAAAPLHGQAAGHIDLRCLTNRAEDCLPEPVSPTEPHGAVCATCHNLWRQPKLTDAAHSCTRSDCHASPVTLTPFHRSIERKVLAACTSCHPAHNARITGRSANCVDCHRSAGQRVTFTSAAAPPQRPAAGPQRRPLAAAAAAIFRHREHADVSCSSCHGSGMRHQTVRLAGLADCRSCHHTGKAGTQCVSCHTPQEVQAIGTRLTRTLEIRIGSLDRPQRSLPFEHAQHAAVACATCHTATLSRSAADLACNTCHEQYHNPDTDCTSCHAAPAPGAHDRTMHQRDCGGAGCHENASASVRSAPRTRSLCLSCHQTRADHGGERACVSCHVMPAVRPAAARR